jgi:hypothetical protein
VGTSRYSAPPGAATRNQPESRVPQRLPVRVIFVPLDDTASERIGFGPNSVYFEYCVLPLIGPSCCLLYRRVAPLILVADSAEVDLAELGRNLGLGAKVERDSAVIKALARLEAFNIGTWRPNNHYALRRAVAPLTDRQAQRLPQLARAIHYRTLRPGGYPESGEAAPVRPGTGPVRTPVAGDDRPAAAELSGQPVSDQVETVSAEPGLAFPLRFQLGELTATPQAMAAAHSAGIEVLAAVLRHLGGDWGDVDPDTHDRNDNALANGGCLRSAYRLPGADDALVVTTDAERSHTTAAVASQHWPSQ